MVRAGSVKDEPGSADEEHHQEWSRELVHEGSDVTATSGVADERADVRARWMD
jgi:hypothetical protein